jgi:hypothetical protein
MSSVVEAPPATATAARDDSSPMFEPPVPLGRLLTGVLVVVALSSVAIGIYNALTYPSYLGQDFLKHYGYAMLLIEHGQIPGQAAIPGQGAGEYYTPPGFYAIAGSAVWVARHLGMGHPERMGALLNVVFVLATGCLLFLTARMLFPRRPVVWVSSVAFLAFIPVVPKVEAMFYPDVLNMLAATAATTFAAWLIVHRRFGKPEIAALAVLVAFDQLVRSTAVFTLVAVAIALAVALLKRSTDRRQALRTLGVGAAALIVLVSPWYVRQAVKYHTATPTFAVPGFGGQLFHPQDSFVATQGGPAHFFKLPLLALYHTPYREHFSNEAFPTMYADTWGDWIGRWVWNLGVPPTSRQVRILRDQMLIGVIPTLLAIGGLGWMLLVGIKRRPELLPVALLVPLAFAGYFYFSYVEATNDGDRFQASYLLLTAPAWALGFGVAFDRLTHNRWAMIGLASLLAAFVVLELPILVWGVYSGRFL